MNCIGATSGEDCACERNLARRCRKNVFPLPHGASIERVRASGSCVSKLRSDSASLFQAPPDNWSSANGSFVSFEFKPPSVEYLLMECIMQGGEVGSTA